MKYRQSVFIVDDDPDDRESIRDAFLENKHHHEFHFMKDGDQLLRHLSQNANDPLSSLVLLDLNMPGKDGKDVLKEIRGSKTKYQPIPVIIFTTSASEKDKEQSYELGANCFITKPDSYQDLITITNSIACLWFRPDQKIA